DVAQRAAAEGLSVRQVERMIQTLTAKRDVQPSTERANDPLFDPNVAAATRELEAALGTRVRIVPQSATRGRIEIEYFSADDLDRVYNLILGDRK
ncbi:MAG TPA: hypothetical protein VEX68_13245, partial [Bryobacteraceae bacterium]|nr:hypothetical protein [Bryobacteraceae bacterium]